MDNKLAKLLGLGTLVATTIINTTPSATHDPYDQSFLQTPKKRTGSSKKVFSFSPKNVSSAEDKNTQRFSHDASTAPLPKKKESDYLWLCDWETRKWGQEHNYQSLSDLCKNDQNKKSNSLGDYANIPVEALDEMNEKLRHALNIGNLNEAKQLIKNGANPNERSENNHTTLLYIAAQQGDTELVRWLLFAKRANPNLTNITGRTALHQAALFGRNKVAQLLITAQANSTVSEKTGKTPLDLAMQRNNNKELVKIITRKSTVRNNRTSTSNPFRKKEDCRTTHSAAEADRTKGSPCHDDTIIYAPLSEFVSE